MGRTREQDEMETWWEESSASSEQPPPKRCGERVDWDKLALLLCAVLLPPLGVFLQAGCGKDLAINALLTFWGTWLLLRGLWSLQPVKLTAVLLFRLPSYIPGILHAVYVIYKG